MIGLTGGLAAGTYRLAQINAIGLVSARIGIMQKTLQSVGLRGTDMNYANSNNLVKCSHCTALYDSTLSWARGYYSGTTTFFSPTQTVPTGCCPVCGVKSQ